jgi:hypothetical protein
MQYSLCSRCCCFFKRKRKKTAQRHKWPVPPKSPQTLGTLTQLHVQLLPFLIGRDSSVGEGGDPNQKEENICPRRSLCRQPGPSVSVAIPPVMLWAVPELLLLHCSPLGLPGQLFFPLFTVKVSFTKTQGLLFSSLPFLYSWFLSHPQPSPASKLLSWRPCLRKGLKRLGHSQEGKRNMADLDWRRTISTSQSVWWHGFSPSMPVQPPAMAMGFRFLLPSLLWSYTVGHKLWEICSLLSLCVGILRFLDKQIPFSRQ